MHKLEQRYEVNGSRTKYMQQKDGASEQFFSPTHFLGEKDSRHFGETLWSLRHLSHQKNHKKFHKFLFL